MKIAPILFFVSALLINTSLLNAATMPNTDAQPESRSISITQQSLTGSEGASPEISRLSEVPDVANTVSGDAESQFHNGSDTIIIAQTEQNMEEKGAETKRAEAEYKPDEGENGSPVIADPLAPVNKVVFQFNDKFYFWGLKPVTQVYSHIVPEEFRVSISNVYDNLWAPSRVLNNLFQLRFKAAGNELIRFLFNSFAGIGGMGDMANEALGIKKQEADFGQTLGHYGVGHGIYLVLPVLGPSSVRDGIGIVADQFMHPVTYVRHANLTFGEKVGIFAHQKVNATSFKIGDYETFKESALDPYVSMRDAFVQNRHKMVEESRGSLIRRDDAKSPEVWPVK